MHHRLLLLALATPLLASAQSLPWTWLHPDPIGLPVTDLDMIDAQTGWALACGGYMLKTSDGGASWQVHELGQWRGAGEIQFVGADTGWATVNNGGFLRTTDGGDSWSAINTGVGGDPISSAHIHFADHLHGWLVHQGGTVLATTDGGTSWSPQVSNTTVDLLSVHFTDALTGCAAGAQGTVLRTTDGGQTWTPLNAGTTSYVNKVHFADAQNVWAIATGLNAVYHSGDAGLNWAPVNIGYDVYANNVYFRTPLEGWLLTGQAEDGMYHTTDGGQSWAPVSTGSVDLWTLEYTDALHAVGGGGCASLGYTTDGGATWTSVNSGPDPAWQDLQFVDALNGYACGEGAVVRTTDGGETWVELNVPEQPYATLHFIDPLEGWIGGGLWNNQPNRLYHTIDGGQSWDTIVLPTVNMVYDIWFTDPRNGWVASNINGRLSRTTDGGANWTTFDPPGEPYTLLRVQFTDSLRGWFTGTGDQRYWSDDGGSTWNPAFNPFGQHSYWGLAFRDNLVGVISADTTIQYTTDGGLTWVDAQINAQQPSLGSFRSLAWTGPEEVWCAGLYGTMLRSTDAGQSWTVLETGRWSVWSIAFSGQALYAGGGCGGILRLDDLSVPVADAPPPHHPGALYPNPNDGRGFHVPVSTSGQPALLRVFDGSGRLQVQERVSTSGTASIALAKALAPGAYMVVLAYDNGGVQRWQMVVAE